MNEQSQYEYLIAHLNGQLEIARAKEVELKNICESISSKGKVVAWEGREYTQITSDIRGAHQIANNNLAEHQVNVVGKIFSNICKAEEIIKIMKDADYEISEVKFNFE